MGILKGITLLPVEQARFLTLYRPASHVYLARHCPPYLTRRWSRHTATSSTSNTAYLHDADGVEDALLAHRQRTLPPVLKEERKTNEGRPDTGGSAGDEEDCEFDVLAPGCTHNGICRGR